MNKRWQISLFILGWFTFTVLFIELLISASSSDSKFIWPAKSLHENGTGHLFTHSNSPSVAATATRAENTKSSSTHLHPDSVSSRHNQTHTMADVAAMVDAKIAGKKVMVFSKSTCPFCHKAKAVLKKYLGDLLAEGDYEVMEIESNPDCAAIQDYLLKKTGGRSVPRVFINQKFVGGGDDVVAKDKSGELKKLLA